MPMLKKIHFQFCSNANFIFIWSLLMLPIGISCIAAQEKQADTAAYLFVYFTGNEGNEESIRYAISLDGYRFTVLNRNEPILSSKVISSTGGVRDPHILRAADGNTFYMVATDMVSAKGWNSNRAMVLLKSKDLIHWTSNVVNIQQRFSNQEDLLRVWAPQTIYDEKLGKYMIYWSMKHGSEPDKIYFAYANKDFTDLETEPKQLFYSPTNGACIDGDIVYHQGKYHLFFKTEGEGNGIKQAISDQLNTGYVQQEPYIQKTKEAVEGSSIFQLSGNEGFILMYDIYMKGSYQFLKSTDLRNFTVVDQHVAMDFKPRHGTVIPISQSELSTLLAKFYNPTSIFETAGSTAVKFRNITVDEKTKTVRVPLKEDANIANVDLEFKLPAFVKLSPAPPYNFKSAAVKLGVSVLGEKPQYYTLHGEPDRNPVLDGYFADPEIIYSEQTKRFHLYPTSDGYNHWSGKDFRSFSSADLVNWKDEGVLLDLPRDVSWAKRNAWAPSVLMRKVEDDYRYYFYFSAAQQIGVAISASPTGPFKDSGKALVAKRPAAVKGGGQEIDPDVFVDPKTNKPYLFWGNGYLAVAPLREGLTEIDTAAIQIITPDASFREGVEVFYRKGRYYFMWSENDTRSADYRVRYGIADSPTGKINIPQDNLVLSKDPEQGIFGTGHNSVIQIPGKDEWYIVYHRFTRPAGITMGDAAGYNREVCIDKLEFDQNGAIKKVIPTLKGIKVIPKMR